MRKGYTLYELIITLFGIGLLAFACGVIYVAAHFIMKFW